MYPRSIYGTSDQRASKSEESRTTELERSDAVRSDGVGLSMFGAVANAEDGQPSHPVNPSSYMYLALLTLAIISLYLLYYRRRVVGKPRVVCSDPDKLVLLMKECPALFEEFWPTVWAPQAHMQTLVRVAIQTFPKSQRRREGVRMKDGGHVCLDWYNEGDTEQPTVLLCPGITGSSDENYIRHWIQDMTDIGYRTVVFNYRGCGSTKLSTPKMFCGADTSDLTEVIEHIHCTLPHSPLLAVGVSLGSVKLIKYVTDCKREGKECGLKALLLISVIWNAQVTDTAIHKPVNRYTLNWGLCNNLRGIMKENRAVFIEQGKNGGLPFDYKRALQCTNFRQFHMEVFVPMFGFESIHQMYVECSPHFRVGEIDVPVVALNAADDPFCPESTIPEGVAYSNHNLVLVTTRRGGHIGFMDGLLPRHKNLMDRVLMQFARAVFQS